MAVAARSIALSTDVGGDGFDLYPDTRTQLYRRRQGGDEANRPRGPLDAGRGRHLSRRGRPDDLLLVIGRADRVAVSSAGRGCRTSKASRTPTTTTPRFIAGGPASRSRRSTRSSAAYVDGSLRKIRVTKSSESPRIDRARLIGTGGTTTVRGDELAGALGLYSRWAYFERR